MPLISERELKKHPVAVITVEATRSATELRPAGGIINHEWFNTVDAAEEWMRQWEQFAASDGIGHQDMVPLEGRMRAHLIILIADTRSLKVGRASAFPEIRATKKWLAETLADLTVLFDGRIDAP